MIRYKEFNINPKGHRTTDCSTRALAYALGVSWEEALTEQFNTALKKKYFLEDKRVIDAVLQNHGFHKMKQPRKIDGTKYTIGELDELEDELCLKPTLVVMTCAGHITVSDKDVLIDTWNCRGKTINNFWIKESRSDDYAYNRIQRGAM